MAKDTSIVDTCVAVRGTGFNTNSKYEQVVSRHFVQPLARLPSVPAQAREGQPPLQTHAHGVYVFRDLRRANLLNFALQVDERISSRITR